jgi:hypothetical protein
MRNQSLALIVVAAGTVLAAAIPATATGGSADIAISINGVVKVQKGTSVATSTPGNVAIAINHSTALSYLGVSTRAIARDHSVVSSDGASSSVLLAKHFSTAHTEHGSRNIVIAKRHSTAGTGPTSGAYVKALGGSYAWATAPNARAVAICGGHAVADEEGEHVFDNGGKCRKH